MNTIILNDNNHKITDYNNRIIIIIKIIVNYNNTNYTALHNMKTEIIMMIKIIKNHNTALFLFQSIQVDPSAILFSSMILV